jgi:hypothetical protein
LRFDEFSLMNFHPLEWLEIHIAHKNELKEQGI